jgi:hypothetical protein
MGRLPEIFEGYPHEVVSKDQEIGAQASRNLSPGFDIDH